MSNERGTMVFDEDQLGYRLAAAFAQQAEPNSHRLKTIEDRLLPPLPARTRDGSAPRWYWWLAVGLVSTGAMAWWAGKTYISDAATDEAVTPAVAPSLPTPAPQQSPTSTPAPAKKSTTIYRSEKY